MKTILKTSAFILFITLFFQCKKNNETSKVYFYSLTPVTDVPLSLYIDGDSKGALPFLSKRPECNDDSLGLKTKHLLLKEGKYKIEAKDASGNVKSTGTIKFSKNRSSVSGGMGGQEMSVQNDCVLVGLYY